MNKSAPRSLETPTIAKPEKIGYDVITERVIPDEKVNRRRSWCGKLNSKKCEVAKDESGRSKYVTPIVA